MAKHPPTVRMRRLGAELRKIREELGLALEEASTLLNISKSALHRMENAQVIVRTHEVDYFLIKYEVLDQALGESLRGLAGAGRSKEWVKRHANLSPTPVISDAVRLEQDSARIRTFQPNVVPGLLQTPEYARAVMRSRPPVGDRDYDSSVAFRMARQEALTRPNPAFLDAVISETVLRQMTGGAEVMAGQLHRLLEASRTPNVRLRVLPFSATTLPSPEGAFTVLDVESGDFTLAFIEGLIQAIFLEGDDDVARYSVVFERVCAAALSEPDSYALVEQALRDIGGEGSR
ncbi:Scr1 family TA system antitoxin-like transcriptional regulator [Spirillospora sp. NPDC047279]|uniref:Scr1 family TA system antitoxin-like transcriptional regulator n=1 Tax=Spirillospora sp. NPDC047279 TaxID=3155478 RepID=UPI0033F7B392